MSKLLIYTLASFFAVISGWSAHHHRHHALQKVDCSIDMIERSQIHPNGETYGTTQSISNNWSGYVAAPNLTSNATGSVSSAAGAWTVPQLIATSNNTYSAIWIGIDGFLNGTVEQIGTSHNWVNGAQQNFAWFEMYPNGAFSLNGFPLSPGDLIEAEVIYEGNNTFQLAIANLTKGVVAYIPTSYTMSSTALRSTAEWVVEAPSQGGILPLADFNLATFTQCQATINGVNGTISNPNWLNSEIIMQGSSGIEAQPSPLLNTGDSFQVTWKQQ